jgi:hypothetical protein
MLTPVPRHLTCTFERTADVWSESGFTVVQWLYLFASLSSLNTPSMFGNGRRRGGDNICMLCAAENIFVNCWFIRSNTLLLLTTFGVKVQRTLERHDTCTMHVTNESKQLSSLATWQEYTRA